MTALGTRCRWKRTWMVIMASAVSFPPASLPSARRRPWSARIRAWPCLRQGWRLRHPRPADHREEAERPARRDGDL